MRKRRINNYKKYRHIDNDFDGNATGAIWRDAHCQWSASVASCKATRHCHLGECSRHIALVAAMVDKFVAKHKTLTKHNFFLAIIVLFYSKTE
jgi:hypothetical protein